MKLWGVCFFIPKHVLSLSLSFLYMLDMRKDELNPGLK